MITYKGKFSCHFSVFYMKSECDSHGDQYSPNVKQQQGLSTWFSEAYGKTEETPGGRPQTCSEALTVNAACSAPVINSRRSYHQAEQEEMLRVPYREEKSGFEFWAPGCLTPSGTLLIWRYHFVREFV